MGASWEVLSEFPKLGASCEVLSGFPWMGCFLWGFVWISKDGAFIAHKTRDSADARCANLQAAVDALSKWGAEWHITFEPTKSQAMTIGRKRPTWETPPIIFNENAVEEDGIKMLGLVADKHLTFAPQTTKT